MPLYSINSKMEISNDIFNPLHNTLIMYFKTDSQKHASFIINLILQYSDI